MSLLRIIPNWGLVNSELPGRCRKPDNNRECPVISCPVISCSGQPAEGHQRLYTSALAKGHLVLSSWEVAGEWLGAYLWFSLNAFCVI